MDTSKLDFLLDGLRAASDPSRLRLLAVCSQGEWTVKELTQILGQSQPRVSRHLKLLVEAGLIERFREGAWVFHRRAQSGHGARLARSLGRLLPQDDPALQNDRRRLASVRERRRVEASAHFARIADEWDDIRSMHIDESAVEQALLAQFDGRSIARLLDVGTGTGRVLQLLAPHVANGVGIDTSREMLGIARVNLDRLVARNCQVRLGDMFDLPFEAAEFDAVTLHQVLHFADDPSAVLAEVARVLRPQGRLVIVDFAPHTVEQLRSNQAHRRLGFDDQEMTTWLRQAGLKPAPPLRLAGEPLTVMLWAADKPGLELASISPDDQPSQPAEGKVA